MNSKLIRHAVAYSIFMGNTLKLALTTNKYVMNVRTDKAGINTFSGVDVRVSKLAERKK